eukprot:TRINITY_DN12740_c0_g1_i1.p1 TRINITY_DN12740_c0_g1~~TRINITY_DN12740_c0_g1_i1.p1  ORF type:complete len:334 (-),score=77.50 TRINITY_DN12740_c0_g1_i1:35-1036(-)
MPRKKVSKWAPVQVIPDKKLDSKTCGHNYCELDAENECCSCGDGRPFSNEGYRVYMDGKGFVMAADRGAHYCATCKLAERWKPLKPHAYWRPKKCGHNFCQTFGENACCHCGDLRSGQYFPVYVDGVGWGNQNGSKSMHYCEGCKDPSSEQIIHVFSQGAKIVQKGPAGAKAAPARAKVLDLKYCHHSPDIPVDCKICKAKGNEDSLREYLNPMGFSDEEITQSIVSHYLDKDEPPTVENLMAILLQRQVELEKKRLMQPSAPLADENMKREVEAEKEKNCMVCFENQVNCVLIPCGHMGFCYDCGEKIREDDYHACPLCRTEIQMVVKTFKV